MQNLYSILAELRRRHPHAEIESCSGGGARVDLGILRLTDEVWPSDNTDPFDRLSIQDRFTYAYAPGVMMAWVTDSPNWMNGRSTSLEYRFLSSMQGSLGVGADLNRWTPEDFTAAKRLIAEYKVVRATVQEGTLYRLISPLEAANILRPNRSRAMVMRRPSSPSSILVRKDSPIRGSICAGLIGRLCTVFMSRRASSLMVRHREPAETTGCTMESASLYVVTSRRHSSRSNGNEHNERGADSMTAP